jgi:hypothetical protein
MRDAELEDAAAYAAGELDSAACARFEAKLRAEPSLMSEVAFWRQLHSGLAAGSQTPGTCPDLSQTLLRRAALERQQVPARALRLPRWVPGLVATAACLALGLGFGLGATWAQPRTAPLAVTDTPGAPGSEVSEIAINDPITFAEDGSGVMPPSARVAWTTWMPLNGVEEADSSKPLTMVPTVKPWIGLWTRQARLVISGVPAREAHLVTRIIEDSPAWKAGLRPGDMIVSIDGCAVDDPTCLGQHLARSEPGDTLALEFWSGADAAFRSGKAVLTAARE